MKEFERHFQRQLLWRIYRDHLWSYFNRGFLMNDSFDYALYDLNFQPLWVLYVCLHNQCLLN